MKSPAYTTQGLETAFLEWQRCLTKYLVLKEYSFPQIEQPKERTVAILGEFLAPIPETFPSSGRFKDIFPWRIGAKFRASIHMKREYSNDPYLALELGTENNFSVCNGPDWSADFADPTYMNEMIRRWRELGLDETELSSVVITGHDPRALSKLANYAFPENAYVQYSKDFSRYDGTAIFPVGEADRKQNEVRINLGEIDENLPEFFSGILKGVVADSGEAVLDGKNYRQDIFDLEKLDGLWKLIGSASPKAAETAEKLLWRLKLDYSLDKRCEVPLIDAKFVDRIALGKKWDHNYPSTADSGYLLYGRSNYTCMIMQAPTVPDSMKERLGQHFIILSADRMIQAFNEHITAKEAKEAPTITA